MTEQEELEYLRLKKRKAVAMQAPAPAAQNLSDMPNWNEQLGGFVSPMVSASSNPEAAAAAREKNRSPGKYSAFEQLITGTDTKPGWTQAQQPKMGRMQSAAMGVIDMASSLPGIGRAVTAPAEMLQPGFDGKAEIKGQMNQSLQDNPISTRLGQGVALTAGGGAAGWKAGERLIAGGVPALSKAIGATSGSLGDKAIRYGGRLGGLMGLGAAENAAYNITAEGRNQSNLTGEDVSGVDVAKDNLLNPYAMLAPAALSGIFRLGKYAKSGGQTFTPDAVAARVDSVLTPGSSQILNADQFGVIEPKAEALLVRLLRDAGYTRDDITSALHSFENSIEGVDNLALLPTRLKDALVVKLGDGAEEAVDGFLQGAANRTGTQGASAVSSGVAEDAGRISQFVNDSADSRFGSGSRFQTLEGAEQELSTIGNQYETLFKPGAVVASPADEQALKEVVDFYANDRELSKYVSAQASKLRMTPQQYIAENPRRAAHLMQQVAREIVDENPSPTLVNAYSGIRDNLLKPLEASTPGYNQVRKEFGDEYGFKKALSFAGRFFTKAEDEVAVGQLAKEYAAMTPRQQDAAKLAMRDESLKFANRRSEGGSPRLSKIGNEPSLAAMERVFGQEGAEFANDIRTASDRLRRNQRISPGTGSNTMNKQEASAFAEKSVSNPMVRAIGNGLQNIGGDTAISGVTGFVSPVMTGRAMLKGMGNALAKGRQGKIDKLSDLLMRDAGGRPRAPMSGDGPVPTPTAAPVNALSQSADPVAAPARSFTRNDSGMVTPDAASALSVAGGAGTGASMAGDVDGDGKVTWKDRATGAAAGAAVGYGLKKGIGATSDALFTNQVMAREGGRASRMASEAIANIPKPSRPGQPMTGAEADDLLTARLNEVLAKNRIDPRDFYAGTAKIDQKKFAPMQEAERLVLEDMKALGYGPPADAEWLRAIRTFSPEQYNKWQATGARDMVSKFRQVQGKEMTPEIPSFEGPRVIDSPGRSMVKPRPSNDTTSSPKIQSDVPLGTPAKGKTKLPKSLDEMMAEPVPMQGIAKATGHSSTIGKVAKREAEDMMRAGKTATEIHKKTGLVPIEIGGKRVLINVEGGASVDEVLTAFYAGKALPRNEQPKWVQELIDDFDPLVLKDGKKPLVLDRPLKGPVRGAGLLAIGGAGAVAAGQGPGQPRNDKGQFTKAPADDRKLMNRALATQRK